MRRVAALLLVMALSTVCCGDDDQAAAIQAPGTSTVDEPWAYGDDGAMDGLWNSCADGMWAACDALFIASLPGSDYEAFAATCGERTDGSNWCGLVLAPPEVVCVVQGCGPDTAMPEYNPAFEEFAGLLASGFGTRMGALELPGAAAGPGYLGMREEFGYEMETLYGAYGPGLGDSLEETDLENMSVSEMYMLVMSERQAVLRDQLLGRTGNGEG